jgi:hypothetical protein
MVGVSLRIDEDPIERLDAYGEIPISFQVDRVLELSARDSGLGGIVLTEADVASPWIKDYDAEDGEGQTAGSSASTLQTGACSPPMKVRTGSGAP